ncbi:MULTISPECIES: RNA polymerase sigma factor [unclassified Endozoicomonas]|uniref:RNA polymerase sigma factor n=1 Tax=unclassified Endozoicomonas TaxID=2644528 RepID=UPI0021473D5C|nr:MULTISPECIES: sigma-70 family RNA polymerase sigma factor [unclassified Endozoicomonas]
MSLTSTSISTPSPQSLAEDLARCARGEQKAFKHLYQLTSSKLFALILRILKDRELAEDCLQQVYIKIWQASSSYNSSKAAPMTWMNTIARNQALDHLRKLNREPQVETEALDLQVDQSSSQEQKMTETQNSQQVHRCLRTLNDNQRRCLELSYFDGMTHQNLSNQLEVPIGTVKTWIRRGLMRLKECMTTA